MTECYSNNDRMSELDFPAKGDRSSPATNFPRSPSITKSTRLPNFFIDTILSQSPPTRSSPQIHDTAKNCPSAVQHWPESAGSFIELHPAQRKITDWRSPVHGQELSYLASRISHLGFHFQASRSAFAPSSGQAGVNGDPRYRHDNNTFRVAPDLTDSQERERLGKAGVIPENARLETCSIKTGTTQRSPPTLDPVFAVAKNNSKEDAEVDSPKSNPALEFENNSQSAPSTLSSKKWPAWVYCTRYSDRPSAGPRTRRAKRKLKRNSQWHKTQEDKRARVAFTSEQLKQLQKEFESNQYLTENKRVALASELGLTVTQIKVWFQNKRAKVKKSRGVRNVLAMQLLAQGLYNHCTQPPSQDDDEENDSRSPPTQSAVLET